MKKEERRVVKSRETGQPSIVYDMHKQYDMHKLEQDNSRTIKYELAPEKAITSEAHIKSKWATGRGDVADIASLPPRVSSSFVGTEHALITAYASEAHPVNGIYWIIPSVIGISYVEIASGYDFCIRAIVADVLCCRINEKNLSAHLPLNLVFAKTDIEVGMDIKKKEFYWQGSACYRGFDTAWRWRCAEGRGAIIKF